jgi:hypothetical protein
MAEAVSRRPLTSDAQIWFRIKKFGIWGGQIDNGKGFCLRKRVSPVNIILLIFSYMLNFPERHMQEAWKPLGAMILRESECTG